MTTEAPQFIPHNGSHPEPQRMAGPVWLANHEQRRREQLPQERINHPIPIPKIAVVDITPAINAAARDAAAEALIQEKSIPIDGRNRLTRTARRIGRSMKESFTREKHRQDEIQTKKRALVREFKTANQNPVVDNSYNRTSRALRDRFLKESSEFLTSSAINKREVLSDDRDMRTSVLREFADLINDRLSGRYASRAAFEREKERMFDRLQANSTEFFHNKAIYSDNLWGAIEQMRANEIRSVTVQDLDKQIILGRAKDALQTNTASHADRVIEKLSRMPYLDEATVAASVAAVIGIRDIVFRRGLAQGFHATAGLIGLGVLTGAGASSIIAAARVKGEMDGQRQLMLRALQRNEKILPPAKYEKLLDTLYDSTLYRNVQNDIQTLGELERTHNFVNARNLAAEVDARIKIADTRGIGLFAYSTDSPAEEQLNLEIAKAQIKTLINENSFDQAYEVLVEQKVKTILADMQLQDKLYRRMRRREQAKQAGKSLLIGAAATLTVGELIQSGIFEIAHHTGLIRDKNVPLFEKVWSHFHKDKIGIQTVNTPSPLLPDHLDIVRNGNSINIIDPNTHTTIAQNLAINPDGSLTDSTKQFLSSHHVIFAQTPDVANTSTVTDRPVYGWVNTDQTVSLDQWRTIHAAQFTSIGNRLWLANNTQYSDGSELAFHISVDPNNHDLILSANAMKQYVAHQGNIAESPAQIIDRGNMKVFISLDDAHQNQVLSIPLDGDGNARISPDNPAWQLFSIDSQNRWSFNGSALEVARKIGINSNGTEQDEIFATALGANSIHQMTTKVASWQQVGTDHVASVQHITNYTVTLKPDTETFVKDFPNDTVPSVVKTATDYRDPHNLAEAWYITAGTRPYPRDFEVIHENTVPVPDSLLDPHEQAELEIINSQKAEIAHLAQNISLPFAESTLETPERYLQEILNPDSGFLLAQFSDNQFHELGIVPIAIIDNPNRSPRGETIDLLNNIQRVFEFQHYAMQHPEVTSVFSMAERVFREKGYTIEHVMKGTYNPPLEVDSTPARKNIVINFSHSPEIVRKDIDELLARMA